jgi:hypothetical protein
MRERACNLWNLTNRVRSSLVRMRQGVMGEQREGTVYWRID